MLCACCEHEFQEVVTEEPAVHRLACGDSTNAATVARVMAGDHASLCFTSPPYGQQRDYENGIKDWLGLMKGVFANLPMADDGQCPRKPGAHSRGWRMDAVLGPVD